MNLAVLQILQCDRLSSLVRMLLQAGLKKRSMTRLPLEAWAAHKPL